MPFAIPRWAWVVLGGLALLAALYFALDSYGDKRYASGKADENAAWKKAEADLLKRSANATAKADKVLAANAATHAAEVADERKKIDAANAEGSSPIDVLFGADSR